MSLAHRHADSVYDRPAIPNRIDNSIFAGNRTMKPNLNQLQMQMRQRESHVRSWDHVKVRKCPVCFQTDLMTSLKNGIKIDCCPKCRGVWLDRGELERLIELATFGVPQLRIHRAPLPGESDSEHRLEQTATHHDCVGRPGRKRSWLQDVFE